MQRTRTRTSAYTLLKLERTLHYCLLTIDALPILLFCTKLMIEFDLQRAK